LVHVKDSSAALGMTQTATYERSLMKYQISLALASGSLRVRYLISMNSFRLRALFASFALLILASSGCRKNSTAGAIEYSKTGHTSSNEVVLYCSVDEEYARPIINQLQRETGLRIRPLFDVEAAKTAGLATRLRAEKSRPRADVFWSSATLQTLLLSREGLLQSYTPTANSLPAMWRAKDWVSTGVRCHVLVYNTRVAQPPRVLEDLLLPRFKGKIGISNALFGTGSDWAASLATRRGQENALSYLRRLKANGAQILPGNSVVAERVGRGELLAGLCDTDDFLALQKQFPDLKISLPTNEKLPNDLLFVPMTAAIVQNAPHTESARKLLDALSSPQTEAQIVRSMPGVLPLRASWNDVPASIAPLKNYIASSRNDIGKWGGNWRQIRDPLSDVLLHD